MRRLCAMLAGGLLASSAAQAVVVTTGNSTAPWLGYMNVFALPADGGAYQFGSAWGVPDLVANFDDAHNKLTLSPNSVNDTSNYWYQGVGSNPGGPGAPGNKVMDASLYQEVNDGSLSGQTVTFSGVVLSNTFTVHTTTIFIKDFAPDFSSYTTSTVLATPGAFSISLVTSADPTHHIQFGFETVGVDVWITDTAPFGNVVIATAPAPASAALLGLSGAAMLRRRRR